MDSDEEKDGGNGAEDADGEPVTELTKRPHVILRLLCLEKTVLGGSKHGGGAVDC